LKWEVDEETLVASRAVYIGVELAVDSMSPHPSDIVTH
jgi:hypothetical protein